MNRDLTWRFVASLLVIWGGAFTLYHLVLLATLCPLAVFLTVLLALAFDFSNGVHDAANAIATVVSTRVLTPLQAVVWAACFNFVAAYLFGIHVALTVGKGVLHPEFVDNKVILAGLLGAVLWNLFTWYLGLPTSSSHALIGGLMGAGIAKAGTTAVVWTGILKISSFIVISPILGLVLGLAISIFMTWVFKDNSPSQVDALFRKGQLVSAALYSVGHGANDAQKTMGIIALLLYSTIWKGQRFDDIPFWIVEICFIAMALGTLMGGWRIVKTMGSKITKLNPFGGFAAESGAALTLFATAAAGIPVSTTHTITGSIIGVGATRRLSAVRWGVARNIVWAWILTIPVSCVVGAATFETVRFLSWLFGG
ncbi:MAG: inorganic phosphate transporter [Candidatus Wallbacteria bacterium]|nr:inorganic phosphate transporter [Candidatus Wallbacteria bacterium]